MINYNYICNIILFYEFVFSKFLIHSFKITSHPSLVGFLGYTVKTVYDIGNRQCMEIYRRIVIYIVFLIYTYQYPDFDQTFKYPFQTIVIHTQSGIYLLQYGSPLSLNMLSRHIIQYTYGIRHIVFPRRSSA